MRVCFPDPDMAVVYRTVPVGPATTAEQVCELIAQKLHIANPMEYALYEVNNGTSRLIEPRELLHVIFVRVFWRRSLRA